MSRLTYDDDLFLRMECVLNVPVVNQIVWRFDESVPREATNAMWRNLAEGPLDRTVERVRMPGARDRWTRATHALPLHESDADIPASQLGRWMYERAATALNPIDGPVWELAYTSLEEGGSAISLVASHVVGDGGALTSAAIAAIEGPGDPEDFRSAWDRPMEADMRDAAGQFASAAKGVARVLARSVRGALSRSSNSTPASAEPQPVGAVVGPLAAGDFTPSTVVVDCRTEEWTAAAAAAGGSANSLLVAIALGILTGSGRVDGSAPIKVSLPVSTRVRGDIRANATSGVSIQVEGLDRYRADLSEIRSKSKAAFTALANVSEPTSFDMAKPLMQMLPDSLLARASKSATAPLCLCSNLGDRGVRARSIGGVAARSVAMRSITQNTTAELLRRTKGGVSVWWNTSGETATLCVTGLDPDRFPTVEHLRALISDEYARWALTPTFW